MTYFVMALALVLGFTQCKKEQPASQTEGVHITLTVDGGSSNSRVNVDPTHSGANDYASVTFENGDTIFVGYKGAYVGYLIYGGGTFSGEVAITSAENPEPLHFYCLGGQGFMPSITGNTATVVISDQSSKYPVISYSPSNEAFTGEGSYSAVLKNKISIMKFNVDTPSEANICITGMNNQVTLDFSKYAETGTGLAGSNTDNGFTYSQNGEGLIKMAGQAGSGVKAYWAIVLPQEAWDEGEAGTAYTDDGIYTGVRPEITDDIASNQYLNAGVEVDLTTYTRLGTPLTFEARTAGVNVEVEEFSGSGIDLYYSTDGGASWNPYTSTITLNNVGDVVSFKGTNETFHNKTFLCSNGQCYIYGNVMSLLHATDYATNYTLPSNQALRYLFSGNTNIDIHPDKDLVLPTTALTERCYQDMFASCSGLTKAPELPAETLAAYCYCGMFDGCSNLTTAPTLPATELAAYCYSGMFSFCSNLTTAPELPAQELVTNCYASMFGYCTSLNSITCLATSGIDPYSSTYRWMNNVSSSGTFTKANGASWTSGINGIPSGWTVVDYAPTPVEQIVDLSTITSAYTAVGGDILTGTLGTGVQISIADGATITLRSANINGSDNLSGTFHGLKCLGDATIILENNDNVVKAKCGEDDGRAGIFVPRYKTLTIQGSGKIEANGAGEASGIGGYYGTHCGAIVINSGKVTATAGSNEYFYGYGAGIGACGLSRCDGVTINGGQTIATGYGYAAGIGTGGSDMATGYCNPGDQAAITISLSSGWVKAIKGNDATYFIGGGGSSHCGYVTIGGTTYEDGDGNRGITNSTSLSSDFTVSGNSLIYMPE